MKKRIKDSEIETAKKSTKVMIVIVMICLLILIGLGIYVGFLYKEGKIFKTDDGKYVIEEKIPKSEKVKQLDVNDINIIGLWENVKVANNPCPDGSYLDKKEVKAKELNTSCKYNLASTIYKNNVVYDSERMITYVTEQNVKKAFETLFDTGSYERQETVPLKNNTELMFNIDNKIYFMNGQVGETTESPLKTFEKITEVTKQNNDLYISSNIIYYDSVSNVLCKEASCKNVIEELTKTSQYNDEYFNLYLESKKDKLYKYTYHYKLNDAGFYKYLGYTRED